MTIEATQLAAKIKELYPEIGVHGLEAAVSFDAAKNAWIVKLTKGENELYTHLEVKDAENCLNGKQCVYLGTHIGQFIEAYCLGSHACET